MKKLELAYKGKLMREASKVPVKSKRTIGVDVYKFDELDPKVQEKVIQEFREDEQFDFLDEYLTSYVEEKLKENNITIVDDLELYYDLSYSQGSGLCFTGKFSFNKDGVEYDAKITHSGNYYYARSVDINVVTPEGEEATDDVTFYFQDIYTKIAKDAERYGYGVMEEQTSDEAIKENIKLNDYEFYADGRLISADMYER